MTSRRKRNREDYRWRSYMNIVVKAFVGLYDVLPFRSLKIGVKDWLYLFCYQRLSAKRFRVTHFDNHYEYEFRNGVVVKTYEDSELSLALSLAGYLSYYEPQEGDIVIDCGSYNGAFAVYLAKMVGPSGRVFAFEPDSVHHSALLNNIKLNEVTTITPEKLGVWSSNGLLEFTDTHDMGASFVLQANSKSLVKVAVVTLDSYISRMGIERVAFIKMDVEGAELEVVIGAQNTLSKGTRLAAASYHLLNGVKTFIQLERLLNDFGYQARTSFPFHLTTHVTSVVNHRTTP
jgi:FkbM family methyltransferase